MIIQRTKATDVDDLLRKTCADDLPADVAAGMRQRIEAFRAAASEETGRAGLGTRSLPRVVWAAVAALMLVAGILLQGLGARSALAEKISRIRAEISSDALSGL